MIPNIRQFAKFWAILTVVKEFLYLLFCFVFKQIVAVEHIRWVIGISFIGAWVWYATWYSEHSDNEEENEDKEK